MPTQRFTVEVSAGIATQNEAGKVESIIIDVERKALETKSTTQPNDSEDGCKSKSEIDGSRVSGDSSSTYAGVQAERYQGMTTVIAIHE